MACPERAKSDFYLSAGHLTPDIPWLITIIRCSISNKFDKQFKTAESPKEAVGPRNSMTPNDAPVSLSEILEQAKVQREGRAWPCEQATSPGHGHRYVAS